MKQRLLTASVLFSALAVVASGTWHIWRKYYSAASLLEAAKSSEYERAMRLVAWGARTDAATSAGATPLHMAARDGQLELTRALISAGADINALDPSRRTPLDRAGKEDLKELLRASGASTGEEIWRASPQGRLVARFIESLRSGQTDRVRALCTDEGWGSVTTQVTHFSKVRFFSKDLDEAGILKSFGVDLASLGQYWQDDSTVLLGLGYLIYLSAEGGSWKISGIYSWRMGHF